MAKRKGTNTKTKANKVAKGENNETVPEKNDNAGDKNENIKNVESNEEKLEAFKKKFGMIKSEINDEHWIKDDGYLIYNPSEIKPSDKIAAFDLDDTLIVPKSGKRFPTSWEDWKFHLEEIPGKLKLLQNEGYKLVIFTNQGGIEKKKISEKDMKRKIIAITEKLDLKIQTFIATTYKNVCRKPNRGMFDLLAEKYNSDVAINLEESFYVGDGAGRPADWAPKKKKDFSCSDRLFALNCKIKFHTPEEYFLNEKEAEFQLPMYNPIESVKACSETVFKVDGSDKPSSDIKDVLPKDDGLVLAIMVGMPASGKSTFCAKHLAPLGYNIINRDTLNTWQKCVAEAKRLLGEKKNVVIDNTNPDVQSRERYLSLVGECGVQHALCFVLDVSESQCRHNELFRELTNDAHETVNEMVFRKYAKNYEEPSVTEKFSMICRVVPSLHFENDEHRCLYARYLYDK